MSIFKSTGSVSKKKPFKIAFGRLMQESNSFSPIYSTEKDFIHYVEGDELLDRCQNRRLWEIDGFMRNMELSGMMRAIKPHKDQVELYPLLSAWAITGGPLRKESFLKMVDSVEQKLSSLENIDAVFFSIHGALDVEGMDEGEAYLFERIKHVCGQQLILAVTMDLHAVLSPQKVAPIDILCAYRTNPHRDFANTGFRAGKMLMRTLLGEIKPTMSWRSIPMISGGGPGVDFLRPMNAVFRKMNQMERQSGVLSCSTFICHPFIDHPNLGWSTLVMTDNDSRKGDQLAEELADMCWAVRKDKYDGFTQMDEAIEKIRSNVLGRRTGTITICDASDVVGAGSTGENTKLLKALIEKAAPLLCYVPLRDAQTVSEIWDLPIGHVCDVKVGGQYQPVINPPLHIQGTILIKKQTDEFGRIVVLDVEHVKLVLTEGAALALKPAFYRDIGLNAWKPDITVVKSFFHFRLFYLFISRQSFYIQTGGITDPDISLTVETTHPVYPNVELDDWRSIDLKRRGIQS